MGAGVGGGATQPFNVSDSGLQNRGWLSAHPTPCAVNTEDLQNNRSKHKVFIGHIVHCACLWGHQYGTA